MASSGEDAELQPAESPSLYKRVWVPTVAGKCHKSIKSPTSSQCFFCVCFFSKFSALLSLFFPIWEGLDYSFCFMKMYSLSSWKIYFQTKRVEEIGDGTYFVWSIERIELEVLSAILFWTQHTTAWYKRALACKTHCWCMTGSENNPVLVIWENLILPTYPVLSRLNPLGWG